MQLMASYCSPSNYIYCDKGTYLERNVTILMVREEWVGKTAAKLVHDYSIMFVVWCVHIKISSYGIPTSGMMSSLINFRYDIIMHYVWQHYNTSSRIWYNYDGILKYLMLPKQILWFVWGHLILWLSVGVLLTSFYTVVRLGYEVWAWHNVRTQSLIILMGINGIYFFCNYIFNQGCIRN